MLDKNFYIHDLDRTNNDQLVSIILNLLKIQSNIDSKFSILVNNGPAVFVNKNFVSCCKRNKISKI